MAKLLFFVTEDWFFVSHFLPMARAARAAGFDVVVTARVRNHGGRIRAENIRLIPFDGDRGSLGLLDGLRELRQAHRVIRTEQPDVVHCIALRSVLIGGIAAKLARVRWRVLAPTGLGTLWIDEGPVARTLRLAIRVLVGSMRGPRTHYIFENADDPREFGLDAGSPEVTIVAGSGVDPVKFPPVPEPPAPPVKAAVVARMLETKGIPDAVAAVHRARELGAPIELHLFGEPDSSNRRSIPEKLLRQWSVEPGVRWHGRTTDVSRVWREHHIAVLLSYYREGVPRALIEAAASGRPIVTTDTVGCREVVRSGQEGILVSPRNIEAAAHALVELANSAELRARMGSAAHTRFLARFTESAIVQTMVRLYLSMMPERQSDAVSPCVD